MALGPYRVPSFDSIVASRIPHKNGPTRGQGIGIQNGGMDSEGERLLSKGRENWNTTTQSERM